MFGRRATIEAGDRPAERSRPQRRAFHVVTEGVMDYEDYEPPECDHDDDVHCTHLFFTWSTQGHLARRRLVNLINAHTHWIFAVTPECMSRAYALAQLYQERCGDPITTMLIHDISPTPVLCLLTKDQVSLDDLADVVTELGQSREVIEGMDWILVSSAHLDVWSQAIERWITTDNLLN
jgi:hypothetical protein